MAPGPVISAMVYVSFGLIITNGFTFHPCPNSLVLLRALPFSRVAIPPLPGSPVRFSGLIDLVFALLNKKRFPGFISSPLKPDDFCALAIAEIETTIKRIFLIQKVLDEKSY